MELGGAGDETEPVLGCQQRRGHPQVAPLSVSSDLIVGLGGLRTQVHRGGGVAGEKGREAAGVVIVAVREDGGLDLGQVHPQFGGVFQQGGGGPGIQQAVPAPVDNAEGQAVLTAQALVRGGVLNESGDFHPDSSFPRTHSPGEWSDGHDFFLSLVLLPFSSMT